MSQNITVSCRRSASWLGRNGPATSGAGGVSSAGVEAGGPVGGACFRAAIARIMRLRSPSEIPSWPRSASVRSARTSKSRSALPNASA